MLLLKQYLFKFYNFNYSIKKRKYLKTKYLLKNGILTHNFYVWIFSLANWELCNAKENLLAAEDCRLDYRIINNIFHGKFI